MNQETKATPNNIKPYLKKAWAITGIAITIIYLSAYFIRPYDFGYFLLGFGIIYLIFVLPLKYIRQ